ncbi:hypothetical protein N7G274_005595 [Stereocaulon virgatum]|uniref:Orc1-like AAA ATPase domain-containing protein n=1 Tax=Stereocaulon virgatum TaxID=373712 RepID=A0ABR4AA98_9LECA
MDSHVPDDLINSIDDRFPCRETQLRQLAALLRPPQPNISTILVHGVEATGKSELVKAVVKVIGTGFTIVRSQECITQRHLLERAVANTKEALTWQVDEAHVGAVQERCESISAFVVVLQRLLAGKQKFIMIFDGIDNQRNAAPTLLPAIVRLGEVLPNLTTILVVRSLQPHLLHKPGIPHIHFPPYTRAETLSILSQSPLLIHAPLSPEFDSSQDTANNEDSAWLWARFTAAVWDSFGQSVARDIVSFRVVCSGLWGPFIQPILDGHYGAREFSKLLIKGRGLLQSETALVDSILPIAPAAPNVKASKPSHILPYYPAHLLIAAYLASHNPPKHDITLFSKTSISKRRKRGGGTALTPQRPSKYRKISRKLLGPQPFPLERLFAIFHAILPHRYSSGGADIMCHLATLVGLRLVVKSGGTGDILEGSTKWRANVGWEMVRDMARGVAFDVESYLME